jgi:dienelactone hydrolase
MKETIVKIGSTNPMTGILMAGGEAPTAPVALMFNSGVLHRVGAFRLWVDLARELASQDIPSLRFDLHGLGDSPVAGTDVEPSQQALADLIAAMDAVEAKLGKREFVIFGLCSGAHYAHQVAKLDARIRGIVFVDGYGYKTSGYLLHHQLKRALSARRWTNLAKRSLGLQAQAPKAASDDETFDKADQSTFPTREQAEKDILGFLDEGRRVYFIFTAGLPEYYSYENQLWDMYPNLKPRKGLAYDYYGKTDHTFALVAERTALTRKLVTFVAGSA